MTVSDRTTEVSAGAQSAIKNAMASLQAYKAEPRVAALISKLATIANPEGDTGDDGQLAKSMADAERIEKSEDVSPQLRERAGNVRLELERAYLRKHSAGGSAVWEREARAAGRAA